MMYFKTFVHVFSAVMFKCELKKSSHFILPYFTLAHGTYICILEGVDVGVMWSNVVKCGGENQ